MSHSISRTLLQTFAFASFTVAGVLAIDAEIQDHYSQDTFATISAHGASGLPKQHAVLTPTGNQLLRREEEAVEVVADAKPAPIAPHSLVDFADSNWERVSAGNVRAICVDDGYIYAVGKDELAVIGGGIFRQPLSTLSKMSDWVLVGYGSMNSIAIHSSKGKVHVDGTTVPGTGKVMYGVANNTWLYKLDLDTMSQGITTWQVASYFGLKAIAIEGDMIYGVPTARPDEPAMLYGMNVLALHTNSGWWRSTMGEVKTLSYNNGILYAIFANDKIYMQDTTKTAGMTYTAGVGHEWTLKEESNMIDIAVWGDTMYGVDKHNHCVHRQPVTINKQWTLVTQGPVRSLAIGLNEDTLYGVLDNDMVHKQALNKLGALTSWEKASLPLGGISSIAVEGDTIYAAASDQKIWKQTLSAMTRDSGWGQASGCCVTQIMTHGGKMYGIGIDAKIYFQETNKMTPNTNWLRGSDGVVSFITARGDTIYGVGSNGKLFHRRLHSMKADQDWSDAGWHQSDFEDTGLAAGNYSCIMAHNDVMYACGRGQMVYTKLLEGDMTNPPNLHAQGSTHVQAMRWNLSDLSINTRHQAPETVAPTTTIQAVQTQTDMTMRSNHTVEESTGSTTTAEASQIGVQNHYIDRFQDIAIPYQGAEPIKTDDYLQDEPLIPGVTADKHSTPGAHNSAWQSAHFGGLGYIVVHSIILALALAAFE